jgi:hypothetical protein
MVIRSLLRTHEVVPILLEMQHTRFESSFPTVKTTYSTKLLSSSQINGLLLGLGYLRKQTRSII